MIDKGNFVKEIKKNVADYRKWEDSLEGILYNLSTWGDTSFEDGENKAIIARTLQRLPRRVRIKVLNKVAFIAMAAQGTVCKLRFSKDVKKDDIKSTGDIYTVVIEPVVIFVNFPKRQKESDKMNTVAHEIAHFILGDGLGFYPEPKHPKGYNAEKAADDLAEKWGFGRSYKSYACAKLKPCRK